MNDAEFAHVLLNELRCDHKGSSDHDLEHEERVATAVKNALILARYSGGSGAGTRPGPGKPTAYPRKTVRKYRFSRLIKVQ